MPAELADAHAASQRVLHSARARGDVRAIGRLLGAAGQAVSAAEDEAGLAPGDATRIAAGLDPVGRGDGTPDSDHEDQAPPRP